MWSKKWYLKRNISCDAHLLNELLETDVALVVSADKLRKLWDSLSELRNSLCERWLGKDSSGACAIACQNCAVYSVFSPSGMTSHSKIAQFNWDCIARLIVLWTSTVPTWNQTRRKMFKVTIEFHVDQQAQHDFRCTALHENHKNVQTACTERQSNLTTIMESTDTRPFTPATMKHVYHWPARNSSFLHKFPFKKRK